MYSIDCKIWDSLASHVCLSVRHCQTYFILNVSPPALYFISACNFRTTHTPGARKGTIQQGSRDTLRQHSRSVSFRNFAVSGKSERMKNEATAQTTVTSPSRMKIHAQPGLPPTPSML